MASAKNETTKTTVEKTTPVKTDTETKSATKNESVYTIDEFCKNAQTLFSVKPECVRAAFKKNGITECGKDKAKKIVEEFMKKEVK